MASLLELAESQPTTQRKSLTELAAEPVGVNDVEISDEIWQAARASGQAVEEPVSPNVSIGPVTDYRRFSQELLNSLETGTLHVLKNFYGAIEHVARLADKPGLNQIGGFAGKVSGGAEEMLADPRLQPGQRGGFKEWTAQVMGGTIPFMAAVAAAGATGGPLAAFATASAVEGEDAYDRAIAGGATEGQASVEGLLVGTINGAIEFMQVGQLTRFGKSGAEALKKAAVQRSLAKLAQTGKEMTVKAVLTAANEGLEEALQEGVGMTAPALHGESLPSPKEYFDNMSKAFAGGAFAGLVLGGGEMAIGTAANRDQGQTEPQPSLDLRTSDQLREQVQGKPVEPVSLPEKPAQPPAEAQTTTTPPSRTTPEAEIEAQRPAQEQESVSEGAGETAEKPVGIVAIPSDTIQADPERFQYKLGATGEGGVSEKMQSVEQWNPKAAGVILVWENNKGQRFVVDGHHRLALAKKLGVESVNSYLVRESEGVSAEDARLMGAMSNLADEKGTAIDAAKVFRDGDLSLQDLQKEGVDVKSAIVRQGLAMKNLSDEVFRMVVDEKIPANMAAEIGKHVVNPVQQRQVARLIEDGKVNSAREAELLAKTIDSAPVLTKTTQTLFGADVTEKSLYAERAKVLANVERILKTNKQVFGTLAKNAGKIEAAGNVLAKEANEAARERADEILYLLEKLANAKGPVSEALNEATIQYAENPTNERLGQVTKDLLDKWEETLKIEGAGQVREGISKPAASGEVRLFEAPAQTEPQAKQPWEMKYDEVKKAVSPDTREELQASRPILQELFPEELESVQDAWGIRRAIERGDELPRTPTVDLSQRHKKSIRRALSEGKPVPREVLEEYKGQPWADEALAKQDVLRGTEKPAGQEKKGAGKKKAAAVSEAGTSARKVDVDADRKAMGLRQIQSPESRTFQTDLDTAIAEGIPEKAHRIAAEVIQRPRPLTDVETAGMVHAAVKLKNEFKAMQDKIQQTEDEAELASMIAESNRIEQEFDNLTMALRMSGTEKGRALASQKLTLSEDYSLLPTLARAKTAKGKSLSESEKARFQNMTSRLETMEARIQELEAEVQKSKADKYVRMGAAKKYNRMNLQEKDAELDTLVTKARELIKQGCLSCGRLHRTCQSIDSGGDESRQPYREQDAR